MTLYEILGVACDATKAAIKEAYKRLAMKHHPDRGGDKDQFQQIQQAYDVLSDVHRRAHYDATGKSDQLLSPEEQREADRRARAMQTIRQVFAQALEQKDEKTTDLLDDARMVLRQAHEKIEQQVKQYQAKRDKAVSAAARVTDPENLLAPILQGLANEASDTAARGEDELLMVTLAVAILESGTYRVDERTADDVQRESERFQSDLAAMFDRMAQQRFGRKGL